GSIRIHDVEVQERVFRTMGLSDEDAHSKFGFLLEALAMGAPPHGGFAMGIERFIALMAGEPDIRQVIAFPKVSSGSDPLTGAPTPMPDAVLRGAAVRHPPRCRTRGCGRPACGSCRRKAPADTRCLTGAARGSSWRSSSSSSWRSP